MFLGYIFRKLGIFQSDLCVVEIVSANFISIDVSGGAILMNYLVDASVEQHITSSDSDGSVQMD